MRKVFQLYLHSTSQTLNTYSHKITKELNFLTQLQYLWVQLNAVNCLDFSKSNIQISIWEIMRMILEWYMCLILTHIKLDEWSIQWPVCVWEDKSIFQSHGGQAFIMFSVCVCERESTCTTHIVGTWIWLHSHIVGTHLPYGDKTRVNNTIVAQSKASRYNI